MTGKRTGFHRIAVLQVAPFVSPPLFAIHIVANFELAKESSHPGISDAALLIQARGNILSKASEASLGGRKNARSASHNELGGFGGVSPPL